MWSIFEIIAVLMFLWTDEVFYLLNFSYIGTAIALGLILYIKRKEYARNMVQIAVGMYMFIYLGIICKENMQIEGFWYYTFMGVFEAATLHYAVAKIFGPLVFGRGWCGYACWTAMVLDLLPFKNRSKERKNWGYIKYIVFLVSLTFVRTLFVMDIGNMENIIWMSFIIGNIVYYAVGIALAYICRDNRAFCKYICPVAVFLKPMSYFSIIRVKVDFGKCVKCGLCEKNCPMDVEVSRNLRKRKNSTECILCMKCIDSCPRKALKL